jgi:hypothetical protein
MELRIAKANLVQSDKNVKGENRGIKNSWMGQARRMWFKKALENGDATKGEPRKRSLLFEKRPQTLESREPKESK